MHRHAVECIYAIINEKRVYSSYCIFFSESKLLISLMLQSYISLHTCLMIDVHFLNEFKIYHMYVHAIVDLKLVGEEWVYVRRGR